MGLLGSTTRFFGGWREEELRSIAEAKLQGKLHRIDNAESLRNARARSGMSIERFARVLGIYPGALVNWERGRKPVPGWVLGRLQFEY